MFSLSSSKYASGFCIESSRKYPEGMPMKPEAYLVSKDTAGLINNRAGPAIPKAIKSNTSAAHQTLLASQANRPSSNNLERLTPILIRSSAVTAQLVGQSIGHSSSPKSLPGS